jgi:hypothetical protein
MNLRNGYFLLIALLTCLSCNDPVHDDGVDALGPEATGVPASPTHRPGQPCRACHGGMGPASSEFSAAGTIYLTRTGTAPAVGAHVTLQDATGKKIVLVTNEAGNFYVTQKDYAPSFPLFVRLDLNNQKKVMQTRIGQNAGCGFCHAGARPAGDPAHMPPIFFEDK